MDFKFKTDKYRKARGGYSRFLDIFCAHCAAKVLVYQKDGPGPLKRLYLDRIFAPEKLTNWQNMPLAKIFHLACGQCRTILGIPYVYPKEKRPAFRLFAAVTKKTNK